MVARGRPSPGHSQARTALFCIAVLVSNVLVFVMYQNSVMTRYITSANAYSASRTDYELEKVLLALEKARQEVAPAAPAAPAATLAQPPPLLPPPPPTQPSVPPPPPKPDVEPEPKPKPKPDPKLEPKLKLDLARGLDLHIDFELSSWSESKFKNSGSKEKSFETVEGYFKDRSGKGRDAWAADAARAKANHVPRVGGSAQCGHAAAFQGTGAPDHFVVDRSTGIPGLDLTSKFTFAFWVKLGVKLDDAAPREAGADWASEWLTIFDNGVSGRHYSAFGTRLLGADRPTFAVDFFGKDSKPFFGKEGGLSVGHNYPYTDGQGSNDPSAVARPEVEVRRGAWVHLAYVYDEGLSTVYVDGQSAFAEQMKGAARCDHPRWDQPCGVIDPRPPNAPLWLGGEAPLRPIRGFKGLLDDVRIYGSRALSEAEVGGLHGALAHCL